MEQSTLDIILNSSVLVVFIGGLFKGIQIAYREWSKHKEKKEDDAHKIDYLERIRSIANVYSIMDKIRLLKGVDRVFMLEISNGGNKPTVGRKMYARGIEMKVDSEVSLDSRDTLLKKYKEVELDEAYIYMCIEIQEKGIYIFDTEKEKSSVLKTLYEGEGVEYSVIYHIHTDMDEEKMFIMSVGTHTDKNRLLNHRLQAIVNSEVNEIQNYFRKYRD